MRVDELFPHLVEAALVGVAGYLALTVQKHSKEVTTLLEKMGWLVDLSKDHEERIRDLESIDRQTH